MPEEEGGRVEPAAALDAAAAAAGLAAAAMLLEAPLLLWLSLRPDIGAMRPSVTKAA
jgi:hypothetical protein